MSTTEQKALELANRLQQDFNSEYINWDNVIEAAAELRRLSAENEALHGEKIGLQSLRDTYLQLADDRGAEIERLRAQVEALTGKLRAAKLHDIDAGIEVMAWLRETRAPHPIYSKMNACLFGDPDRTESPQVKQPSLTRQAVPEGWAKLRESIERHPGQLVSKWKLFELITAAAPQPEPCAPFQARVQPWLMECFGEMIAGDREERNHRFLEEALELVQACGCTAGEAHQLVDYTFGRPIGEPAQEVGGVMVTLAALCLANGLDMHANGETELTRISDPEMVKKIRAKQAAKPKYSPLPEAATQTEGGRQ